MEERQEEQGGTNNNINDDGISDTSKKSLSQQVTLRTVDNFQVLIEATYYCRVLVKEFPKKLLHCEHYKNIYCSDPISTNENCIEKCRKQLECGHECLSECECGHNCAGVCGEICPSKDFCVGCAPEVVKNQVSDINSKINYQKLVLIAEATNFPPHKKAFDAVLSLYRDNTLSSISSETFQEMLSRVGTSIPQVDRRIYLDAFFEIQNPLIMLRFSPNESTDIDDTKSLQERITEKCEDIKKQNCNEIENWDVNSSDTLNFEELLEIHQATKTEFKSSEHWYECPNGHPYTIEECDGAMQMNKCPDCNEQIGGEGHQLVN
ncbi:unnamed protein product [Rhizophagus irregularis]|nr:unnamed protein product [Rhizophagus irregularis]